jgi:hypothetical protein
MIPAPNALISLGGSGTIEEINEKVSEPENFSDIFYRERLIIRTPNKFSLNFVFSLPVAELYN